MLSFSSPGRVSFSLEELGETHIELNQSNFACFLFKSKNGVNLSIEAINEDIQYIQGQYEDSSLFFKSDNLVIKNLKKVSLDITIWIGPVQVCNDGGLVTNSTGGLKFNIRVNGSQRFCIFEYETGFSRSHISSNKKIEIGDISVYRSSDLSFHSHPHKCGSNCLFESSLPYFVSLNITQPSQLTISSVLNPGTHSNSICNVRALKSIDAVKGIELSSIESDIFNYKCTNFSELGPETVIISMVFYLLLGISLIIFIINYYRSKTSIQTKNPLEKASFLSTKN